MKINVENLSPEERVKFNKRLKRTRIFAACSIIFLILVIAISTCGGEDDDKTNSEVIEQQNSGDEINNQRFSKDSLSLINYIYENSELKGRNDISIKVDELETEKCIVYAYVTEEMGTNADVVGQGIVMLSTKWIVQSENYTLKKNSTVRCLVVTRVQGVTGRDMLKWWGTARYDYASDGVKWEWQKN